MIRLSALALAFFFLHSPARAETTTQQRPGIEILQEPPPASDPTGPGDPAEKSWGLRPGLVPALFALIPGFALHGSGVFSTGDAQTALKLLAAEGIGLVGMIGGTALLAWTGATRRFTGVTSSMMMFGTGLFLSSTVADLYGAITGGTGATAELRAPGAQIWLGQRYVHDVQFDYRNLARLEAELWLDRWCLATVGWVAVDDNNQRVRISAGFRPYGPTMRKHATRDGSFVTVEAAGTYHGYETEGFRTLTAEALVSGRYDLARLGRSLAGSFAQAQLGWGLELYGYDAAGGSMGEDASDMLLGGFGWGFYLGEPAATHGEIALYYDHRRDDYTGGAGNGFAGHFGLTAKALFCPDPNGDGWGVRAEAEIGSAFYGGLDLFYQWGAR